MTHKFLTLLLMIGLYLVSAWASDDSEGEVNPNEAGLEESVNESLKEQHQLDKQESKSNEVDDTYDDALDNQEHQANSSFVDPEVAADFQPVARDH